MLPPLLGFPSAVIKEKCFQQSNWKGFMNSVHVTKKKGGVFLTREKLKAALFNLFASLHEKKTKITPQRAFEGS